MRVVKHDSAGIAEAVAVLKAGGVVAHATETCYGLACDLKNPEAVQKLFAVKKRPPHMPVSALFPDVATAKAYVAWNDRAEELAKDLPGPLTLILPMRADAPGALHPTADDSAKTVGVRVSPHPTALALVNAFGSPLSTTSANIHGDPNPYDPESVAPCDLLIDDGALPANPPSRVVDLADPSERVLRQR